MQIDVQAHMPRAQVHAIFVVVPRVNMATLITMIETMRVAIYLALRPVFSWEVVSFDGAKVTASNAMVATVTLANDGLPPADRVFVLGSWGAEHCRARALVAWLRLRARAGARIWRVELGSSPYLNSGMTSLQNIRSERCCAA